MGLVLSVLVACVGVCELFAFYANVRRNLIFPYPQGDLTTISDGYIKELRGLQKDTATNSQKTAYDANVSTIIPSLRLNSQGEVKIPATEKEVDIPRPSSQPLRHFVVSDNLPGGKEPAESPKEPRYVPKERKGTSKIPSPEQFEVTEDELDTIVYKDIHFESLTKRERSLSPFPPLELPQVPRHSVSNELSSIGEVCIDKSQSRSPTPSGRVDVILESTSFNTTQYWTNKVLVVPSRKSRSRSPSPSLRNTIDPEARDHTFLEASKHTRVRSKSESNDHVVNVPLDSANRAASNLGLSDEFEWSFPLQLDEEYLDEVDNAKCAPKSVSKAKTVRRTTTESENTNSEVQDLFKSKKTIAISTHAAEELKKVSSIAKSSSSGATEASDSKHGEPFWLIFSGEYTKAMNKDWHGQHFCCWQCDESLTGQRYVLRDEHPYCVSCYESVFANACEKCSRTIGIDSKDLSYKDKHWHEACFLCTTCGESLVDKQFGSKGDRIYCGSCYDQQFASRCDGCHEIFRAGTKKMEYKTRQWHEKCFCCCVCKVPIGTQSFIPREQEIFCAKCYEEKFATRCIKCNKVITSGGVTYKNEPWHRECFTCTHCTKSLAGERFTSRDEKPYCAECFGELFAKRCTACTKPITGIGGTKFISFEDRHWHNDCFFCASCRTSLVGRGFITDQDDIICPECAKQKLM